MPVYAVKKGRQTGLFDTWDQCEAQVKGFQGAKFKKFNSNAEALAWIDGETTTTTSNITASTSTASTSSGATKRTSSELQATSETTSAPATGTKQVVYSDGACKNNGKPNALGGIGVWWGPNDPRNLSERCPGKQTNNRAELIAILRVLEETPLSTEPLYIKTDSRYSISSLTEWYPGWIRNGWRTSAGPVLNKELIQYVLAHLDNRKTRGQEIVLQYVKGHSGNPGNDAADALAVAGTFLPQTPERDWVKLKAELERSQQQEVRTQSPPKIRKVASPTQSPSKSAAPSTSQGSRTRSPPKIRAAAARGPPQSPSKPGVVVAPPTSQELNDYAAGLLDDPAADLSF
ncbi:Ribonuclease H [Mycena indigotica]|uniref:Ribonuclease H n=1 Tax=Mycena indigotica TaxID=2126181 RepID=A0A8H6W8S3_9AGAR|nr:Ribonuclease H [Mycena indigotica]KAF7307246.1 Ribonuclease H [Mycena indigotica]